MLTRWVGEVEMVGCVVGRRVGIGVAVGMGEKGDCVDVAVDCCYIGLVSGRTIAQGEKVGTCLSLGLPS